MEAMYDNQLMVGNKKILARLNSIKQRVLALLSNYRPFAWRNRWISPLSTTFVSTPPLQSEQHQAPSDNRWRSEDIGTFDPAEDDVDFFVDRARMIIPSLKGHRLVQANIVTLLKGNVVNWFQYELRDNEDVHMQYGANIERCCTAQYFFFFHS